MKPRFDETTIAARDFVRALEGATVYNVKCWKTERFWHLRKPGNKTSKAVTCDELISFAKSKGFTV